MEPLCNFVGVERTRPVAEDHHKTPEVKPKNQKVFFSMSNTDLKSDIYYTNGPKDEPEEAAQGKMADLQEQDCYIEGPKRPKVKAVLYNPYEDCERVREFMDSTLSHRADNEDMTIKSLEEISTFGDNSEKYYHLLDLGRPRKQGVLFNPYEHDDRGRGRRFMNLQPKNIKQNFSTIVGRNDFPKYLYCTPKQQKVGFEQKDNFAFRDQTNRRQNVEKQANSPGETESAFKVKQVGELKFPHEFEKFIKQLEQKIQQLCIEKEGTVRTVLILQHELEKINRKLNVQVSENLKKQEKIDQLQEELKRVQRCLKEQNVACKAQTDTLKKELSELKTKLRRTEERQVKAEQTSQSLDQKLLREKESSSALLEQHLRVAGSHRVELQAALQNLRDQDAKHNESKKLLHFEIRELKSKLCKSEEQKAKVELSAQGMKNELQKQKESSAKLLVQRSQEVVIMRRDLHITLHHLDQQEAKHQEHRKALQSEIQELKVKLSKSEDLKMTTELALQKLKREHQRVKESFADHMKKHNARKTIRRNAQQKCKTEETLATEKQERAEGVQRAGEEKEREVENVTSNQLLRGVNSSLLRCFFTLHLRETSTRSPADSVAVFPPDASSSDPKVHGVDRYCI
ncbi:coiled-coil domain-containing protein 18-like [Poecilia formosa]|uniref:coiled-coil domain-containing protein 18-like n=1 Tax=Poecilia formosa TaxID=48698 RepID=UPI0007B9CF8C|nr:PREDICTED: coiled-coil domain-containing protein 18-like [Poecilia formosa]